MVRVHSERRRRAVPPLADVAAALHALHDVAALSESTLCLYFGIHERARNARHLFAEGTLLREVLVQSVEEVIGQLPEGDPRLLRVRATLEGVLAGRSIAQIARDHGRTREYWSRSCWKQAVELVTRQLARRQGLAGGQR